MATPEPAQRQRPSMMSPRSAKLLPSTTRSDAPPAEEEKAEGKPDARSAELRA